MLDKIFFNVAFSLLCGIFIIFTLSFSGFIFGVNISPFYSIAGILACFIIFNYRLHFEKIKYKNIFLFNLALILLFFAAYFFSINFIDTSYDGPAYHQPAAILMANGYNPIFDNVFEVSKNVIHVNARRLMWIECYPKFSEIFAGNIFSLTQNIEAGKIINYLSILITFCYSFYVLSKKEFFKEKKIAGVFSFLLVYNPVVLCQISTYYNDCLVYLYFLMGALSVIDFYTDKEDKKLPLLIFVMSSTILANIKLGGVLCFLCLIFSAPFFIKNIKKLKSFSAGIFTVIILFLISGINPYFTNIKQHNNPLYPLIGKEKIDIMSASRPKSFENRSVFYKFFISTFSKADNIIQKDDREPVLKIPFTIHKGEIGHFYAPDVRISGFGVFFSGIFLLSLIMLCSLRYKSKENKRLFYLIFFMFGLPLLLNPESWWARYIPYLWGLIVFINAGYFINSDLKYKKYFVFISVSIMFINSLLVHFDVISRGI